MNLQQFSQALRNAADAVRAEAPNIVRRAGMDALAVVERRIKEKGIEGERYKSKGKAAYFQGGAKTGAFKNYATHGKVDLTLTNRMWNGTSVLGVVEVRNNVFQAQIGGTDQEVDTKITANRKRFGDFLQPTEQEEAEITEDMQGEVLDVIRRHLDR